MVFHIQSEILSSGSFVKIESVSSILSSISSIISIFVYSAKSDEHFVDTKGMVVFDDGEDEQTIEVPLIATSKFNDFVEFKVVLIEPQGKCSLGNNQKCYVRLLPPEAKFMFSEKYLTYRLSEKMAIIPVERRFISGVSTLKWHTRWSKDKDDDKEDETETEDEPRNWASGFIVFKVIFCRKVIHVKYEFRFIC